MSLQDLREKHKREIEHCKRILKGIGYIQIGASTIQLSTLQEWADVFEEDLDKLMTKEIERAVDAEIDMDMRNWQ